jgi:hypothetical protein
MKKLFISLVALIAAAGAQPRNADACTVMPVNATFQKNELVAQALNTLEVSIEQVVSIDVADYLGDYIWTPMCPKGVTSQATFTIHFDDALARGCTAVVKVSKHFLYENGAPDYDVEVMQPAVCLE